MLASAPILHSVLLLGALFGTVVGALDFGRYDEAHRVTKSVESMQPVAATITTAITTATFTTVTVSARNSDIPTRLGRLRGRVNGDDANQGADTGTSTTSTPETASSAAETDNSGSDSQDSLSSTQLGGIIGGAAAFLCIGGCCGLCLDPAH